MATHNGNEILTTKQVCELLGVSRPTLYRLIEAGKLPPRIPGWRLDDVEKCKREREGA
nr:helix-turn-helix domain-containing protein [Ensifer aridi]